MTSNTKTVFILSILFTTLFAVATKEADKDSVSLVFAGDINFSDPVRSDVKQHLYSYKDTLSKVTRYIREADIAFGNLESPFVPKRALSKKNNGAKLIFLDAEKQSSSALRFAGFDVMTLANNHLNDYGDLPVNYTVDALKEVGIKTVGVTHGPYNSNQVPLILETGALRIGVLAYCITQGGGRSKNCSEVRRMFQSGPAVYQKEIATKDVNNLKEKAVDVIVVLAHWGRQYTPRMNNLQKQVAHHLTSLGVQLIIGCHPHVEQPYSYHGNRFVAYSLGNLVFLHSMTPEKYTHPTFSLNATRHGRLVRAEVSRRGVTRAQYLPYEIRVNQTNHCIQPTPLSNAAWIDVCGQTDTACLKDIDDTCHL
ncbi:capsule biosynthesis protein CapA-like [Oculina patagonica]